MKKKKRKNAMVDTYINDQGVVQKKDVASGVVIALCVAVIAFLVFLSVGAIANL